MIYDVLEYGAIGDGKTNDTSAIQKALDECCNAGGGTVVFRGGHEYRAGFLRVGSHTRLELEMGAVLKAGDSLDDFLPEGGNFDTARSGHASYDNCEYDGLAPAFFIYAKDAEYITISGDGIIDGNEHIFYGEVTKWHIEGDFYPRVPLLFFENVKRLQIRNITLANSAFWTTHLVGCEDVTIDGVSIYNNLRMANCDGIDPDHCKNVHIANCHIECADDCIVFKNTAMAEKYGNCENITVANCTLKSTSSAIKFGTESESLFRNITVSNCNISESNRGIALMVRDKGSIENVTFTNINIETRLFSPQHYWGKAEPIYITALPRKAGTKVGHIKNITFENINCDSESGIVVCGCKIKNYEEANISGIRFKNVSVYLRNKTDWPKGMLDLRPEAGDGLSGDGLRYIYVKNAHDIQYKDVRYDADKSMKRLLNEDYMGEI